MPSTHGIFEVVDGAMLGTVMDVASDPRRENRDAAGVVPSEKMLGATLGVDSIFRGPGGLEAVA